ncbi:hypothetical protein VTJ49DRAFT_2450 [Mycothermus thermophilus]|uniref:Uncharacterized protein n=1 Tax=Humicola insolens TaxID=85995 RepID=A0ABR3V9W7_HUMIN
MKLTQILGLALFSLPSVLAAGESCYYWDGAKFGNVYGTCGRPTDCVANMGYAVNNRCPGGQDNKCCIRRTCTNSRGQLGRCATVARCNAVKGPGHTEAFPRPKGTWNPPITNTSPLHEVLAFTQHNLCAIHAAYADLLECIGARSEPHQDPSPAPSPATEDSSSSCPPPTKREHSPSGPRYIKREEPSEPHIKRENSPEQVRIKREESPEARVKHESSPLPAAPSKLKPENDHPSKDENSTPDLVEDDSSSSSSPSTSSQVEVTEQDEEETAFLASLSSHATSIPASTTITYHQPLQNLHALTSESLLLARLLDLLSDFPLTHTSPVISAQVRHAMLAVVALGATLSVMVSSSQQQQQSHISGGGGGGSINANANAREQVSAMMRAAMQGVEEARREGGASFNLLAPVLISRTHGEGQRQRQPVGDDRIDASSRSRSGRSAREGVKMTRAEERRKRKRVVRRRSGVLGRILGLGGPEMAASILEGMWVRMRERREALEGAIRGCLVGVRGNVHDGWTLSHHEVIEVNERFKAIVGRELLIVEVLRRRIESGRGDICRLNDHESAILGLPQTSTRVEQWRVRVSHDPDGACLGHADGWCYVPV